jgi:hypothetical protein
MSCDHFNGISSRQIETLSEFQKKRLLSYWFDIHQTTQKTLRA